MEFHKSIVLDQKEYLYLKFHKNIVLDQKEQLLGIPQEYCP
jgi:hypothetical protein